MAWIQQRFETRTQLEPEERAAILRQLLEVRAHTRGACVQVCLHVRACVYERVCGGDVALSLAQSLG
jgi:hypothetical protein